jgi:hypothetical protein
MKSDSKHFTIEEVAAGLWVAIQILGGSHICNSGIIDLGDKSLIFDTR